MQNEIDIEELNGLFQCYNFGFNDPENEFEELQTSQKMLEDLIYNYTTLTLNLQISDLQNIGNVITLQDFLYRLQRKNNNYIVNLTFDTSNEEEMKIQKIFYSLKNIDINDFNKYVRECYNLYSQIINFLHSFCP